MLPGQNKKLMTYISLKWGTLKSWDFSSSEEGQALLEEYAEIGASFGSMSQRDTARQKEIICRMIDICDGDTIYLDWDGEAVSKDAAKKYVMDYGKTKT